MLRKLPLIGSSISFGKLLYALKSMCASSANEEFSIALSKFTGLRYIYLTNSGISAFYIILKVLKEKSGRHEVILPAYTAGSLVVAVIKAGLVPVLCDISPEDFNLDTHSLSRAISSDTLGVVAAHMFGIGIKDIGVLRERLPPDIFLIEDCAQSMGSRIKEGGLGNFSDVSFFSFGRGKNLAIYSGGCIATNNEELAGEIEREWRKIKEEGLFFKLSLPWESLAFSLAVTPFIYGLLFPFISRFKDTIPPKDLSVAKMTDFQAGLGIKLIEETEAAFSRRYLNGLFLTERLKGEKGIILPRIPEFAHFVFNRFPIMFEALERRGFVEKKLLEHGIESSRMYLKPLHRMFDLGYKKEDFPHAGYLAEHILTLPVHPLVREQDLERMVKILTER